MARSIIVVTGLPASGKTTLARLLGEELGFPVIDKDDFLEALLGSVQEFDADFRSRCSREADKQFENSARSAGDVILVSHWQHPDENRESGTPSAWVRELGVVVEIFCECSVATAAARFMARNRHPGHGDDRSNLEELTNSFQMGGIRGPLGIGTLIMVNTEKPTDVGKLARDCHRFL